VPVLALLQSTKIVWSNGDIAFRASIDRASERLPSDISWSSQQMSEDVTVETYEMNVIILRELQTVLVSH